SSSTTQQVENYLFCDLGTRRCIFPPGLAREIIPPPYQVTRLPATPAWMPGLTMWRGEIIPLVDVWAYLLDDGGSTNGALPLARPPDLLVVIQGRDCILGLLVMAITPSIDYDDEHMVPFELAPDWCSGLRPGTIKGVLDDALVLDVPFIFNDIVQQIGASRNDKGAGISPEIENEIENEIELAT
ncbi:MAG TPA: chemotaxis protein CheW, partial [Ktedonobacteraceae bacterium]|nr:chemotaxis protein CheW [Ktedonobacteraceae bacterium]